MFGGGNPAHIPQMQETFRAEMEHIVGSPKLFSSTIGDYDPPQGNVAFIDAFVNYLNRIYDWWLKHENVATTNGAQKWFFTLFNLLAGETTDGKRKKILFPLSPEYIGYEDQWLSPDMFVSCRPHITELPNNQFKYDVDFDALEIWDDIGAICVSRPTNPTGNVITDEELAQLSALAKQHNIPLIIDNAYGEPFPNIIFTDANLVWDEHIILTFSLSKIGLPTMRCGMIVANADIIRKVSAVNAITNLSGNRMGQTMMLRLLEGDSVTMLARDVIKPYYQVRCDRVVDAFLTIWGEEIEYRIHKPEWSLFVRIWLPKAQQLMEDDTKWSNVFYQKCKDRGLLIVPWHYFFPWLPKQWRDHMYECFRMSYAVPEEKIPTGVQIMKEVVQEIEGGR